MSNEVDQQQAVADLARQVVAEMAPDELPMYRPLSQAYFKNPEKAVKGGGGKDQMLGFGAMEAMAVMQTIPILDATHAVVHEMLIMVGTHVGFLVLRAAMRGEKAGEEVARELTPTHVARLRQVALKHLDQIEREEQAGRIAEGIIGRLGLA